MCTLVFDLDVIQLARNSTQGVVNVCSSTFTDGQIRPDARPMQTKNTCFSISLSLSFREPFSRRRYFLLLSFLSEARRYVQESSKNTLLFFLCPLVSRSSQSRMIPIKPCEFFTHVKHIYAMQPPLFLGQEYVHQPMRQFKR